MDERFKNPLEHTEKMEALLKKTTEELRLKSKEYRESLKEESEEVSASANEKVRDLFSQQEENLGDKLKDTVSSDEANEVINKSSKEKNPESHLENPNESSAEKISERSDDLKSEINPDALVHSESVQEITEALEENNPTEIEDDTLEHIEYHPTEEEEKDDPDPYTTNEDLEVEERIVPPTINDKFQNNSNADILNDDVPQVIRPEAILADDIEVEENIEGIAEANTQVITMIDQLRNLNYARDFGILMYALTFPLILLLVWLFIRDGYSNNLLVAIPLIIFFLIYRSSVRGLAEEVYKLKATLQTKSQKAKQELFTKIDYVDAGIDLNRSRVNYTQIHYMIFSPFLFYALAHLWKGPFSWITTLYLFGVAYLLSVIIWPMVFKKDKEILEEIRGSAYDIKRDFL